MYVVNSQMHATTLCQCFIPATYVNYVGGLIKKMHVLQTGIYFQTKELRSLCNVNLNLISVFHSTFTLDQFNLDFSIPNYILSFSTFRSWYHTPHECHYIQR